MRIAPIYTCLLAVAVLMPAVAQAQWRWTPETGRWVNVRNLPRESAELQLQYARGLYDEGKTRQALRETDKFDSYYGDSEFADDNQYLRGEIRLASGDEFRAAKEFQQVVANYPNTDLFDNVIEQQYSIGDRLYEKGQVRLNRWWWFGRERPLRRAAEVYGMVVENQPFTAEAAEAQYKIGLTQQARKNYYEAAFEYRRVIEDYSGSDWVDDASYALAKSYEALALPPEYDQSPSQLTIRAIDDFTARFAGDERADELGSVRDEMRERIAAQRLTTARFYEKRRDFAAAKLYYQNIVKDFEGTQAAATAAQWLADHPGVKAPFEDGIGRERAQ
jgi:outer membrane protein assembly factor BamD